MAKILLVEDDNNLREIYEVRLQAEGFTIISAKDGEEALVVAKQERPDMIISDVMMPKISGFEMLDIMRNTPGLRDTKVIMLTALGQADDQSRADHLGADRYLVKSQVTLEDIVRESHALLGDAPEPQNNPELGSPQPRNSNPTPTSLASAASAPVVPAATVATPVTEVPAVPPPLFPQPASTQSYVSTEPQTESAQSPLPAPVPMPSLSDQPKVTQDSHSSAPASLPTVNPVSAHDMSQGNNNDISIDPEGEIKQEAPTEAQENKVMNDQIESFLATTDAGSPNEGAVADAGTQAANDQTLTHAVDNMMSSTPLQNPDGVVAKPPEELPPTNFSPVGDRGGAGVTIEGKKIIQPPSAGSGSNLNELLAREEAMEQVEKKNAPSTSPSHPASPFDPNDPNNIAL